MDLYGLIGFPLTHSFSKKYFSKKFETENLVNSHYELFEIESVDQIKKIIQNHPNLKGLNVTIPHKESVIPMLDQLETSAKKIGAVNVIKIEKGKLVGYNSDFYGFKNSLIKLIGNTSGLQALVLGTGGASKAVVAALDDLGIPFQLVSRSEAKGNLAYKNITSKLLSEHRLIINTSPLGMYPNVDTCPELPYASINSTHFLFDLVYNPEITLFMKKGLERGAKCVNGLEMLHLQAEKAWEIWNG